jgi:hypothetical protein
MKLLNKITTITLLIVSAHFLTINAETQENLNSETTKGLLSFFSNSSKNTPAQESNLTENNLPFVIQDINEEDDLKCYHCCNPCPPPKRLCLCQLCAKTICAKCAKFLEVKAKQEKVQNLWANTISTCKMCAFKARLFKLWSKYIRAKDVCVKGNVVHGTRYKASMSRSSNLNNYKLGSVIDFETVRDDPNSDLISTTTYRAPITGYYVVSARACALIQDLQSSKPLTGTPIAVAKIYVNGEVILDAHSAFLGFGEFQNSTISGIICLNAGDLVDIRYALEIINNSQGQGNYNGTITLCGSPTKKDTCFAIHYLSSRSQTMCCPPPDFYCGHPQNYCDHHCHPHGNHYGYNHGNYHGCYDGYCYHRGENETEENNFFDDIEELESEYGINLEDDEFNMFLENDTAPNYTTPQS